MGGSCCGDGWEDGRFGRGGFCREGLGGLGGLVDGGRVPPYGKIPSIPYIVKWIWEGEKHGEIEQST